MTYLRHCWYIAAWSHDIEPDRLFARKILDEPVVFFRKTDGTLAAIQGRCPHRFAPLQLGSLKDDAVQCGYHGLTFAADGRCIFNPHSHGAIPSAARVKAYPVVERHMAAWIWMGDEERADAALIPDYSFLALAKPTARSLGYLHAKANYELLSDNILDLSHVDFLHPKTLGGGAISKARPNVTEEDGRVRVKWEALSATPPPFFLKQLDDAAAADICHQVIWTPPALMELNIDITVPQNSSNAGVHTRVVHLMTPETETSTHYFFAQTRNYMQDDAAYNEARRKVLLDVFASEDLPMVQGQQEMMGTPDFASLDPMLLPCDAGSQRARRALERLKNEEALRREPGRSERRVVDKASSVEHETSVQT